MALRIFQALALSSVVSAQDSPDPTIIEPPQKGPSAGGGFTPEWEFDDWNNKGFNGGVAGVCAAETGGLLNELSNLGLNYAGTQERHGPPLAFWHCFDLLTGEQIIEVTLDVNFAGVVGIQFGTSLGRKSPWWGGTAKNRTTFVAPSGPSGSRLHLVALYGKTNIVGQVNNVGVYWGNGGGTGQWVPILSCPGCSKTEFKYSICSKMADGTKASTTTAWKLSVPGEMAGSFSAILGLIKGQFFVHLISGWISHSVTEENQESFETTDCKEMSFSCPHANLFQWTFTSNFDLKGDVHTATRSLVCTDKVQPCCLPGAFSDDPTKCDVHPDWPNGCNTSLNIIV